MRFSGFLAIAALVALPMSGMSQLVISEVVEGTSGNFKYVEILNQGALAVDLTAPQITLKRYANGNLASQATISLAGTIAGNGGRFVIANNSADYKTVFGASADASQYSTNINFNGDDSLELLDGTTVLDGFAMDWPVTPAVDPGNPAADGAYFRVLNTMPNNGNWGGTSANPIADGADSPSGFWTRVAMTPGNGNAAAICTPFATGGAGGREVPVAMSAFSID